MDLRIFVGFDSREAVAYHVCCNSLIRHASRPLSITPLDLGNLEGVYEEKHKDGSNAFIYSRFLVPYLAGFRGTALYLDGDMIVTDDIAKIFDLVEVGKDVMVVKHNYETKYPTKYFGAVNESYPKKNWSSVMLFPNCSTFPVQRLTPSFVAKQTGEFLHRMQWTTSDRIGSLPKEWNWLVGEYETNPDAKLVHYTISIPAIQDCGDQVHAKQWWDEYHKLVNIDGPTNA